MFNKDIVQLCNQSQKKSGLTLKNLRTISEIIDTKSKAKTREGMCEAIIKKVYENRMSGKPDFYNENWGFDKYACRSTETVNKPIPPPQPMSKTIIGKSEAPIPPPPPLNKSNKKPDGPSWSDVMNEMKKKANAKQKSA